MKTRCLTRTAIQGEAVIERPGQVPRTEPIAIQVEHQQSVGVCNGLARGAAWSGRSASIALAEKLQAIVGTD